MRSFDDPAELSPAELSPAERLSELATIFAAAILRLHARSALATVPDPTCLEVPLETGLNDHRG